MGKEVTLLRIECSFLRKTRPPNKECGGEPTEGGARRTTLSRAPRGGRKRGLPPKHEPPPRFQDRPEASRGECKSPPETPKDSCFPGEAGLRLNCVARRRPGAEPAQPRGAPQSHPVQAPHFLYPGRRGGPRTLHASQPPRPSPWKPLHRSASRVLTATPGRARPPLRGRAARDAPRGRSGRARGGGRAGRARSRFPPAPSFRHGRAELFCACAHGDPVTTWPAPDQPPCGLPPGRAAAGDAWLAEPAQCWLVGWAVEQGVRLGGGGSPP